MFDTFYHIVADALCSYRGPQFGKPCHMEPYRIKRQDQNKALRIHTGCTRNTNTQHIHEKTKVLLKDTHLKLHAAQLKQLTQTQTQPVHDLNAFSDPPRNMKATIFHNNKYTYIIISKLHITPEECRENLKHINTIIISQYLNFRKKQQSY